jgi:hypothetical protein
MCFVGVVCIHVAHDKIRTALAKVLMKVHSEEVEAVLNANPRVRNGLLDSCRRTLPPHKVPAMLRFVAELSSA